MTNTRNSIITFIFCFISIITQAQYWHYYNPTIWYDVNTVEILDPGTIVIGGGHEAHDSTEIMFQTTDYGLTWYENAHDGLAPWIKSIAFANDSCGIAVGYEGRIIRSCDAGRNWGFNIVPINRDLNKIVYAGAGTYYAAGGHRTNDSMQTILKSKDNGNTWTVIYDDYGTWLKSIFFIDTLKGFAVGDNGVIMTTSDSGYNWTPSIAPLIRDFNAITFINANIGYIVGGSDTGSGKMTILRTIDGGLSWNVLMDANGGILKDISFATGHIGYIVGDSATILKTSDGGLTWLPIVIDSSLTGLECFNTVKFYNKNFGAIGGRSGELYVYHYPVVDVYALGAVIRGADSVTLLGAINTHNRKARYSFVYSKNFMLAPSTTQEVIVKNDSLFRISENINNLAPNTTYSYFLKAITATDTAYSDTLYVNPSKTFQTLDANAITSGSATLNGFVSKFNEPVSLFFEYGQSLAFGNVIQASPALVNDTMIHYIQANISGLQNNSHYYFRLKGVTPSSTYYGETKTFLAFMSVFAVTLNASDITLSASRLNGAVNNNGLPTALKFEYGLTSAYGNEISAVPDSVFGSISIQTSVIVNGLTPDSTYHFRIKAVNQNCTSYGDDMTFITGGPSVSSSGATNIGLFTAQLNGFVRANNSPAVNIFEYGTTQSYGNEVTAMPDSTTGNTTTMVSYILTGLSQGTSYHYRIKATNTVGTNYGADQMFTTFLPPLISTFTASDIGLNSARLNGAVYAAGIPTALKFEYGTTTSFGNEIAATPDSSLAMGTVNVNAFLTGLVPNTFYYYRLKGIIYGDSNVYGPILKFYTAECEIPNCGFELWDTVPVHQPVGWTVIGAAYKVPSYNGTSAIKIGGDGLERVGGFCSGKITDPFSHGGIPFSARPDSIVCHIKYNIAPGDTAYVFAFFKSNNSVIYQLYAPVTGNSGGNFIRFSYPLTFPDNSIPDTLQIGAVSTNAFWSQANPVSTLTLDDLAFIGTGSGNVIPNSDFENWNVFNCDIPNNWSTGMDYRPDSYAESLIQKTSACVGGNYAALMQNHPAATNKPAILSVGDNYYSYGPTFPLNVRHETFNFYARYLPQNKDTLTLALILYSNSVQIGSVFLKIDTPVSTYFPFNIKIVYFDSISIPDSASLVFNLGPGNATGNSKAWIDNLSFDGFSVINNVSHTISELYRNMLLNIYPNPANSLVNIDYYNAEPQKLVFLMYDVFGKLLYNKTEVINQKGSVNKQIDISSYPSGVYLISVASRKTISTKKLVIQK